MLRFAILKEVNKNNGENKVVLEYDENIILTRLQARVKEGLSKKEKFLKHTYTKTEIEHILTVAFNSLIREFKEKTVTLM